MFITKSYVTVYGFGMTIIKKSVEEIERKILDLSKELDECTGSKAHGIRQVMKALNWGIGE